jgi:hypothetical protein
VKGSPHLARMSIAVNHLLVTGMRRGYVTYEELNNILPVSDVSADEIEALLKQFTISVLS